MKEGQDWVTLEVITNDIIRGGGRYENGFQFFISSMTTVLPFIYCVLYTQFFLRHFGL